MALGAGQYGMMGWAEMAKCHLGVSKFKNGVERRGCRRRDDVAVDVMTIVGCVLWGGRTFSAPRIRLGERRYYDNLLGRDYTRESQWNISSKSLHCQLNVNQKETIFQPNRHA